MLEEDGLVVGYAYANRFSARPAYAWSCAVSVYLDRDRQRSGGGGRQLYTALFARLAGRGFRRVFAGMSLPNDASAGSTGPSASSPSGSTAGSAGSSGPGATSPGSSSPSPKGTTRLPIRTDHVCLG